MNHHHHHIFFVIVAIRDTYIRSGEGFLLVFDVTDAESFTDLNEL